MKPFLSIVIPCYNCSRTIGRLLDSILQNNISKELLEIIICDDKSTDNFLSIVKEYESKLNIIYCTTTRDFHCPGNTRQAALPYVTGEWLTFIDNDDMFEPDAFSSVQKFIKENNVEYTLVTNFREFDPKINEYTRTFERDDADTWIHGKYFNVEHTLNEFHCFFKEDLFSHEDLFFNSFNLGYLISVDKDYVYFDKYTYKWCYEPKSLSRSYFSKTHYYIEEYLGDYILASSESFFILIEKDKNHFEWYKHQIIMALLHAYFYYQASIWRLGYKALQKNIVYIHDLKIKIIEKLNMYEKDIIDYVYSNPKLFNKVRRSTVSGSCEFIQLQSFRDFILNI